MRVHIDYITFAELGYVLVRTTINDETSNDHRKINLLPPPLIFIPGMEIG
jgi:hypothetical protein